MGSTSASCVLASASPRRRDLLAALGVGFDRVVTALDERAIAAGRAPAAGALAVAVAKAEAAPADARPILAADTIVVLGDDVLGKPHGADDAAAMLTRLGAREHDVITAVALRAGTVLRTAIRTSRVQMRAYTPTEIAAYVATGSALDKAGAYGIQDEPFRPVAAIIGCWCNVMGLPLWTAVRLLDDAGCAVSRRPDQAFPRCASCPLAADPG
ncbi:MAG: septum formation protein Maf [bacterium]|nr:septum formation protein Maf [bacterium]